MSRFLLAFVAIFVLTNDALSASFQSKELDQALEKESLQPVENFREARHGSQVFMPLFYWREREKKEQLRRKLAKLRYQQYLASLHYGVGGNFVDVGSNGYEAEGQRFRRVAQFAQPEYQQPQYQIEYYPEVHYYF